MNNILQLMRLPVVGRYSYNYTRTRNIFLFAISLSKVMAKMRETFSGYQRALGQALYRHVDKKLFITLPHKMIKVVVHNIRTYMWYYFALFFLFIIRKVEKKLAKINCVLFIVKYNIVQQFKVHQKKRNNLLWQNFHAFKMLKSGTST